MIVVILTKDGEIDAMKIRTFKIPFTPYFRNLNAMCEIFSSAPFHIEMSIDGAGRYINAKSIIGVLSTKFVKDSMVTLRINDSVPDDEINEIINRIFSIE